MSKFIWVARDWTGNYNVFTKKPFKTRTGLWLGNNLFFMRHMESTAQKELLGLRRHIRKSSCKMMKMSINTIVTK